MKKTMLLLIALLSLSACSKNTPTVNFHTLDNNIISSKQLQGKWILLNFWASWCGPCAKEIPQLNAFYQKHQQQVMVFGINYDALPANTLQRVVKQLHIKYPQLIESPAKALNLGDIDNVPVTYLINPQGQLTEVLLGEQTLTSLEAATHLT